MGLQVYKISNYDHLAKERLFNAVKDLLEERFGHKDEACVLIGNCIMEGAEVDALLITGAGARILAFKDYGGMVIANENGTWTAEGMSIEGGTSGKTPLGQMRHNRTRVAKGLASLCETTPPVSAAIIFGKESTIDTSGLSAETRVWLHVCDGLHLDCLLDGMDGQCLSDKAVADLPQRMSIKESLIGNNGNAERRSTETYEPEVATDLFEELEETMACLPDYGAMYDAMHRVFKKCLELNTADVRLNLGGTFAKTDYLLKERQASPQLAKMANDTRVRLKKRHEIPVEDLKMRHLHDLRNLCKFTAFLYRTEIPSELERMLPASNESKPQPTPINECMRLVVDSWDKEYIHGTAEDSAQGESLTVCYAHGNEHYPHEWSYLHDLLYKGAQINLIRPRLKKGILFAELVILEPDYLVDISAVAYCFTNYAESPMVNLIGRLQPQTSMEARVLGNFAGQLLDEQIHQLPNTRSYEESAKEFWKSNAISLLTTPIGPQFHEQARTQKTNIAKAFNTTLPQSVSGFNPKEGMVEPSFFSEMLGLQGRMDYLQLDYRMLIEQKSGKGEYPQGNYEKPRHKEEHYVQMLLYMMLIRYNFSAIYEENNRELSAFLLYSKYSEGLTRLGFAPELIFRAVKIRNQMAWMDMQYTQKGGFRILDTLKPEHLNTKNTQDAQWQRYQYQQIETFLHPIQKASELTRAYYHRFLSFIANEHLLSKLGNKTKENSGFAAKWHDSLEEKRQAGNIYDNLHLLSPNANTEGKVEILKLGFPKDGCNDMSNFRTGDIVVLYPYEKGTEPDVRKTMVFRCDIANIETDCIELKLRAAQSDARAFLKNRNKAWAIEHDFMESSYSTLYKGMHTILTTSDQRRDLLLLQREPEISPSATINGEYGNFNDLQTRVKRAKDLFLIIGPPGTGKTSYGLLNTLKEELTEPDGTVLLLSYTNRAVDEICSKLYKDGTDFIRIGRGLSCSPEYRDKLLEEKARNCRTMEELKQSIRQTRVFVATTTTMNSNIALLRLKQFSLAIVDEASQILEPHLIGILCAHNNGEPAIRKTVLIGDHKQLPAVVQQQPEVSKVQEAVLNDILLTDCRLSLFERLLRKYRKNPDVVYMLKKQGRMHHDIALFPNYAFYNNQLQVVPLVHQNALLPLQGKSANGIDNLLETRRIAFINAETPHKSASDKVNPIEADIVAATVLRIYEREKENFKAEETVGVIVPYRNQIATIRNTIDKSGIRALHDITIDTVERYQGSQRKYIIYGFTIQKYYQLGFLTNNVFEDWDGSIIDRKLNVAMTRAEEHLILVGNAQLLSNNFTFFKLIEFIKSRHGFFQLPRHAYTSGNFEVPTFDPTETDLSKAVFATSERFGRTFDKLVREPLQEASGEEWPQKAMGYDTATCLNAIGYGRSNIYTSKKMYDEGELSASSQVLLYCNFFMRQHYCSSASLFARYRNWLLSAIRSVDGRLHFIDIGCGPASAGVAWAEIFSPEAKNMVYTGIDSSAEMRSMAQRFVNETFSGSLHCRTAESLDALGHGFWKGCSELPSLIVFNFAYFFSNVSPQFAERLAAQLSAIMRNYPLNRYAIFVQHAETDKGLNAFKVFRRIVSPLFGTHQEDSAALGYTLNGKECQHRFLHDTFL